jgi:stage II sporulation protein D
MRISLFMTSIVLLGTLFLSCNDEVNVNIIGYPRLDSYTVSFDTITGLTVDKREYLAETILIDNTTREVLIDNRQIERWTEIKLPKAGTKTFISKYGSQNYHGSFTISGKESGISMVNTVPLDHYLASVLGSEMGESFSRQTLLAQSIIIRTYYYSRKKKYSDQPWDINNADGRDMVYRGAHFATEAMYTIMKETSGLFLVDRTGQPGMPLFHSTSGGYILRDSVLSSEPGNQPSEPLLLLDRDLRGDDLSVSSPWYSWTSTLTIEDLLAILYESNLINRVELPVKLETVNFSGTPCVDYLAVIGPGGEEQRVKSYNFVSKLQRSGINDFRSIQFTVTANRDTLFFTGKGFGHLCGMSQYSAERLVSMGYNYNQLLDFYYPHLTIKKMNQTSVFELFTR